MSVVLLGEGKSFMAFKYLGRGSIVLSDTLNFSEVYAFLSKLELVRAEHNPCLAYMRKEVDGPPPVLFEVGVIMDCVVDTTTGSLEVPSCRASGRMA